jgi:hypothetical protein
MTSATLTIRPSIRTSLLAVLAIGFLAGCTSGVAVTADGGGSSQPSNGGTSGGAADDQIKVRFFNDSDAAVDTQFYATNDLLEDPTEDLFQPQYRIQTGVGLAGSGLLEVNTDDEIGFPCTENTIVGTEGGEFQDPDLGTLLATGQQRILRVGDNFDCGNTIIFAYTGSSGNYTTEPPVVDSR